MASAASSGRTAKWESIAITIRCGRTCGSRPTRPSKKRWRLIRGSRRISAASRGNRRSTISLKPSRCISSIRSRRRIGPAATGTRKLARRRQRCGRFPRFTNRHFAAIEAGMSTFADDGVPLNHFYAKYASRPADLPSVETVRKGLNVAGTELMALRAAPPAQDYTGPVLFEARAAAPMLAQVLGPAVNGARPPISFSPVMEQLLGNLGGKSDWVGRLGARVLPSGVSVVDDPGARDFNGAPLIGGYAVDDEGVRAEKATLVESGNLKNELMSRRPGPDSNQSNGHGRAAFLNDAKPTMSNLFFSSAETLSTADLKKKFLDTCRAEKMTYCLVVREMDNPTLSLLHQEDFSELLASYGGGAGTGDRLPLVVYRIYPENGREEMIRGSRIIGLNSRALRNLAGIGSDSFAFNYMQSQDNGFAGTALGAFGSARSGLPASVVAPSLLFEELEVRGARGEAKRLPLLPPPPMSPAK